RPDNARAPHAALAAATQLSTSNAQLSTLRYSVCALGDTNYTQFCKCGVDFDTFLEKLGGVRASPRADCDLEYEEKFTAWLTAALAARARSSEVGVSSLESSASTPTGGAATELQTPTTEPQTEAVYSKKNPF